MKGVVSAGHELTVKAGLDILDKGGNAFDAAIAASFASFVCEGALTSPAGGGFFIAHPSDSGVRFYDFFTDVPGKGASREKKDMNFFSIFIDFADVTQELRIGEGSAAVPGVIAGLERVYNNHATLPIAELLAPAITYAREGIKLNASQAYFNHLLSPLLSHTKEGRDVYAPGGNVLKEGETIKNLKMADALEALASDGLSNFYSGYLAGRLLEGFGDKGLITGDDLSEYKVVERVPLEVTYRGRRIYTNPPPSAGGTLIAFALKLMESFDVSSMKAGSTEKLLLLLDVMRATDMARAKEFDPNMHNDGVERDFLGDETLARYALKETKGFSAAPGPPSPGNTTHISVIDAEGNAAGITTSTGIGCGVMIPGTGIMMNNMLGEEDLNPAGFHKQPPGLRMSSMMAPTIVMHGDEPEIVLGSGGSKRIRSAILQVISNIIDHDIDVDPAVNNARVHFDGLEFQIEKGVEEAVIEAISEATGIVNSWRDKNVYFGGVHTARDEAGVLTGAGDRRRGGASRHL